MDKLIDELISSCETIVEENEELLEENKNLKDGCEDEDSDEEEHIFKQKEKEKAEEEEFKKDEEEFKKKTNKALLYISKQIEDQEGGVYNTKDKKPVIFDNLSMAGGMLKDEDVKNIVVSFF